MFRLLFFPAPASPGLASCSARVQYIVDGNWQHNPNEAHETDASGNINNVFTGACARVSWSGEAKRRVDGTLTADLDCLVPDAGPSVVILQPLQDIPQVEESATVEEPVKVEEPTVEAAKAVEEPKVEETKAEEPAPAKTEDVKAEAYAAVSAVGSFFLFRALAKGGKGCLCRNSFTGATVAAGLAAASASATSSVHELTTPAVKQVTPPGEHPVDPTPTPAVSSAASPDSTPTVPSDAAIVAGTKEEPHHPHAHPHHHGHGLGNFLADAEQLGEKAFSKAATALGSHDGGAAGLQQAKDKAAELDAQARESAGQLQAQAATALAQAKELEAKAEVEAKAAIASNGFASSTLAALGISSKESSAIPAPDAVSTTLPASEAPVATSVPDQVITPLHVSEAPVAASEPPAAPEKPEAPATPVKDVTKKAKDSLDRRAPSVASESDDSPTRARKPSFFRKLFSSPKSK